MDGTPPQPRSLTAEEVQYFRHNGFLKLPWRQPDALIERLLAQIAGDVEAAVEPLVRDYRGDVMRLSAIWQRGGAFRDALAGPAVLPALRSLLGPAIELQLNRHNHLTLRRADDKTAMSVELHRDVSNWTRTICTIITYLEPTTLDNGCTQIIPGSHLLPDVQPGGGAEQDPWLQRSGLLEQRVALPMPAGGMLLIDSMLLHAAGPNRTNGTRMSLTAGYHASDGFADTALPHLMLISGERTYRGNDRPEAKRPGDSAGISHRGARRASR